MVVISGLQRVEREGIFGIGYFVIVVIRIQRVFRAVQVRVQPGPCVTECLEVHYSVFGSVQPVDRRQVGAGDHHDDTGSGSTSTVRYTQEVIGAAQQQVGTPVAIQIGRCGNTPSETVRRFPQQMPGIREAGHVGQAAYAVSLPIGAIGGAELGTGNYVDGARAPLLARAGTPLPALHIVLRANHQVRLPVPVQVPGSQGQAGAGAFSEHPRRSQVTSEFETVRQCCHFAEAHDPVAGPVRVVGCLKSRNRNDVHGTLTGAIARRANDQLQVPVAIGVCCERRPPRVVVVCLADQFPGCGLRRYIAETDAAVGRAVSLVGRRKVCGRDEIHGAEAVLIGGVMRRRDEQVIFAVFVQISGRVEVRTREIAFVLASEFPVCFAIGKLRKGDDAILAAIVGVGCCKTGTRNKVYSSRCSAGAWRTDQEVRAAVSIHVTRRSHPRTCPVTL